MTDPFPTTQWTAFLALRDGDDPEGRRLALAHLYERYWPPLYSYVRRRGFDQDQSADLLQGFFAHLLERDFVDRLELTGKLRAFLIAALKLYISSELDRERALKRNPVGRLLSLDVDAAEQTFRQIPSSELSPEEVYERHWALGMMRRAQQRLEKSESGAGRAEAFRRLSGRVYGTGEASSYEDIAEGLGITESAVRVRVHRLRKRFGRLLREDIALTVTDDASVDAELRHLVDIVG